MSLANKIAKIVSDRGLGPVDFLDRVNVVNDEQGERIAKWDEAYGTQPTAAELAAVSDEQAQQAASAQREKKLQEDAEAILDGDDAIRRMFNVLVAFVVDRDDYLTLRIQELQTTLSDMKAATPPEIQNAIPSSFRPTAIRSLAAIRDWLVKKIRGEI